MTEKSHSLGDLGLRLGKDIPKLPQTSSKIPKSILKRYNAQCKTCTSDYFDQIHQWILQDKTSHWISARVAEMGELVNPNSISNHRKKHLQKIEVVREFYLGKTNYDVRKEINNQLGITKLELKGSQDLAHRRFLMQRIDKLLSKLISLESVERKAPKITAVDRRSVSINLQGGGPTSTAPPPGAVPGPSLERIGAKILEIQEAIASGNLEIVDEISGEILGENVVKKAVLSQDPFKIG